MSSTGVRSLNPSGIVTAAPLAIAGDEGIMAAMNAKPKPDDPESVERAKALARELDLPDSDQAFERVIKAIIPPRRAKHPDK